MDWKTANASQSNIPICIGTKSHKSPPPKSKLVNKFACPD